jgi:hypothetical protein
MAQSQAIIDLGEDCIFAIDAGYNRNKAEPQSDQFSNRMWRPEMQNSSSI